MPGSLVKEYLIGLGFEIDESGATSAQSILDTLQETAVKLDGALHNTAEAWGDAMSAFRDFELPDLTSAGESLARLHGAFHPLRNALDFAGERLQALNGGIAPLSASASRANAAFQDIASAIENASSKPLFPGLADASRELAELQRRVAPVTDSAKQADDAFRGTASAIASASAAAEFTGIQRAAEAIVKLQLHAAQLPHSALQASEALEGVASSIGSASTRASELSGALTQTGGDGEEMMSQLQASATSSAGQMRAQYVRAAQAVIQSLGRMSASGQAQMTALQASARSSAAGIQSAYRALGTQTASIFRSMQSTMTTSITASATTVVQQVERVKNALLTIPTSISVSVNTTGKFAMGGVVDKETQATVGEDGREYIIPVTKPARALPLITAAMKDMGLIDGAQRAQDHLKSATGESAARLIQTSVNRELHTTQQSVSAPATINVYGTQAEAIAKKVQNSHESLIIRNLKGALS